MANKTKGIEMPPPTKIYLKNLVFDPDNPNEMSDEQESALDAMFEKFGFLSPVVVAPTDSKGKQLIHHGEHRCRRLMEAGNTWVWGYAKKLSAADHKLLRQGMNKTHGEHTPEKDAVEIGWFQKKGMLEMLSKLTGQPKELLELNQETVLVTQDKEMIQHHKETFLEGNLKQLYFVFSNEQYEKLMPRIDKIIKHSKVDNNTDMFLGLVKCYENTHLKKKR